MTVTNSLSKFKDRILPKNLIRNFVRRTAPPSVNTFDHRIGTVEQQLTYILETLDPARTVQDRFLGIQRDPNRSSPYRTPTDLEVTRLPIWHILMLGECHVEMVVDMMRHLQPHCQIDYVLFNNFASLPDDPPHPPAKYQFQIVQVPLRSVMPDSGFLRLPLEADAWANFFDDCETRLVHMLEAALKWNTKHGLLSFVANFMVPQQNAAGRLLPRDDFRNTVYFVRRLNDVIDREIRRYADAYVLDSDAVSSTYGRRYFQDDVLWITSHNSILVDHDILYDKARLEVPVPVSLQYRLKAVDFGLAWWKEVIALYRAARQVDAVKLVIVDLDDTLWRGIAAEREDYDRTAMLEGWPMGLTEALLVLKKRGILLAIVSKNDEAAVNDLWEGRAARQLKLDDFFLRKVNWNPKADNIREIIAAANVLPRNVVFIDDNPVERAAVEAAIPEIRVLGGDLYCLRRILLWAPETQVPTITTESGRRTEMVQAQVERETARRSVSHEEFLASLKVKVRLRRLQGVDDNQFPRAFELVNKTNQFNTTGRRWTRQEAVDAMASGTKFHVFEVDDKFTEYGLVGVVIVAGSLIEQFVMSCRVFGLGVETAVLAALARALASEGKDRIEGQLTITDANGPCRGLFENGGMKPVSAGHYACKVDDFAAPPTHVSLALA